MMGPETPLDFWVMSPSLETVAGPIFRGLILLVRPLTGVGSCRQEVRSTFRETGVRIKHCREMHT